MEEEELARRRRRHWLSVLHLCFESGRGGAKARKGERAFTFCRLLESRAALNGRRPQASGRREERRHDGARSLVQNKESVRNGEERRRL